MKLIICLVSRHLRIGIIRTYNAMEFEELSASIDQFVLLIDQHIKKESLCKINLVMTDILC